MLCLFMCRTYFEIIVYKYFAIGCCKLCCIVRLLGPILLSYIVVLQHFQLWSYPFFYDSKFFSIFVCHLFRLFIVQCFFRSIFLLLPSVSLLTLLPHPHAYAFNFSQSPHVPSSSCFAFFNIVCYNNTNAEKWLCACDRYEQSLEPYDYKLSGAANH